MKIDLLKLIGWLVGYSVYQIVFLGNFIPADNSLKGKKGSFYGKHGGFCLETQTFPDAINHSFDHDSILRPGQVYDHQVMYKFFF
jgi:aldose 1-epimerase